MDNNPTKLGKTVLQWIVGLWIFFFIFGFLSPKENTIEQSQPVPLDNQPVEQRETARCIEIHNQIKDIFLSSTIDTNPNYENLVNNYFDTCAYKDENGYDKYYYLSWMYFSKGQKFYNNNDFEMAVNNLSKGIDFNNKSIKKRPVTMEIDWLGISYYNLGQYEQAKKYLEASFAEATNPPYYLIKALGNTYSKLGEYSLAQQFYEAALDELENMYLNGLDLTEYNIERLYLQACIQGKI